MKVIITPSRNANKYRTMLLETREKLQQGWICFIHCRDEDHGMKLYHDIALISTFKISFSHRYNFKSDYSVFHPDPLTCTTQMTYTGIELYLENKK